MPHSFNSSLFHCVFSTKQRRNTITPDLQERFESGPHAVRAGIGLVRELDEDFVFRGMPGDNADRQPGLSALVPQKIPIHPHPLRAAGDVVDRHLDFRLAEAGAEFAGDVRGQDFSYFCSLSRR